MVWEKPALEDGPSQISGFQLEQGAGWPVMGAPLGLYPGKATRWRRWDRLTDFHHWDQSIRHVVRRRSGEMRVVTVNPVCIRRQ